MKLEGPGNFWRLRTASKSHRVIYRMPDKERVLWVADIGDRKDVYRHRR